MPAAIGRSAATLGLERAMLVSLALVLSLAACQEPEQATGPSMSQAALPNSITLTYICGNSFRVRNTNPEAITVTWDVYQQGETGTLVLPPKPASAPYSETYFTTVKKGTVRLFLDGVLKQTKANGNKPVCELPAQSWPKLGAGFPHFDTTKVVTTANGQLQLFSTDIKLRFQSGTSDAAKSAFFARNSMLVVGEVSDGAFFVRIPDPGTTEADLYSAIDQILADPIILHASPIARGPVDLTTNARFPADGFGFGRADWLRESSSTWAMRAIRAPLAWGCENGDYGGFLPRIGLLEYRHNASNPELSASSPQLRRADTLGSVVVAQNKIAQFGQSEVNKFIAHATWTSTLLGASGDNGEGVAGVLWRSRLFLYEALDPDGYPIPFFTGFYRISNAILTDSPRILSVAVDQPPPEGASDRLKADYIRDVELAVQFMLDRSDSLTVVVASGDEHFIGSREEYEQRARPMLLISALLRLKPQYPDRILIVSGTSESGQFAASFPGTSPTDDGSNYFTGLTDILAPAADVTVQTTGGSTILASGTSLSAPLVAGVAGQILAMNPLLTPSDIARLLREGAKQERINPTTGTLASPPAIPVTGSSDVVHQLDAYGSLSLLSATDDATPICGFPVITSFVTNPETNELETVVRLARPNHYQSVYQGNVENVTVAQGGRRIGIDSYDESRNINFQITSWAVGSPMAFRGYRQFLEKDTAFTDYAAGPAMVTIRGSGSPRGPYDLCAGVTASLPAFGTDCYLGPIGSSGGYAQVTVERSNYDVTGCGPDRGFYGSYLVPITSGGAPEVLREVRYEPCPPETGAWTVPGEDAIAWRADGAVAWVAQSDASYLTVPGAPDPNDPNPPGRVTATTEVHTTFRQVSVESGLTVLGARTVNNRFSYALGWRSDASTLISYEYVGLDWTDCQRIVRAGLAPEIELPNSAGSVPWCGNGVMEPLAAPRLMARLAGALSARSAAAPGGPALATRTRAKGPRMRTVQPIVLVN